MTVGVAAGPVTEVAWMTLKIGTSKKAGICKLARNLLCI